MTRSRPHNRPGAFGHARARRQRSPAHDDPARDPAEAVESEVGDVGATGLTEEDRRGIEMIRRQLDREFEAAVRADASPGRDPGGRSVRGRGAGRRRESRGGRLAVFVLGCLLGLAVGAAGTAALLMAVGR